MLSYLYMSKKGGSAVYTVDPSWQYGADQEKRSIRKNAERVGFVLLLAVGLQVLAVFADVLVGMLASGFQEVAVSVALQDQEMTAYLLVTMAEYIFYMGVPVLVGWLLFRKRDVTILPHQKTDASLGIGLILLGLGMMVIANIIGSYILTMLESIGISAGDMPEMQDGTVPTLLLNIVAVGILPGILEELLFRGVVLQGLRPAGDGVALVFSSLMFGLMHGTLYQIPFAFILGLVFGYIVLKTGNILWTMLLHVINNTLSVLMEFWLWNVSDEETGKWYLLFFAVEALLGMIGAAVLMMRDRTRVPPIGDRVSSYLTKRQRRRAAYSAVTVIIFIVIMGLVTLTNVQLAGATDFDDPNETPAFETEDEQQSAAVFAEVMR